MAGQLPGSRPSPDDRLIPGLSTRSVGGGQAGGLSTIPVCPGPRGFWDVGRPCYHQDSVRQTGTAGFLPGEGPGLGTADNMCRLENPALSTPRASTSRPPLWRTQTLATAHLAREAPEATGLGAGQTPQPDIHAPVAAPRPRPALLLLCPGPPSLGTDCRPPPSAHRWAQRVLRHAHPLRPGSPGSWQGVCRAGRRPAWHRQGREVRCGRVRTVVQAGLASPAPRPGVGLLFVREEVHFSDTHKGAVWPGPCSLKCALWASSTGSHGTLLEMQNPGPTPDLQNPNLRSARAPGDSCKHFTLREVRASG